MFAEAVRTFPRRHAATRRFTLGAPRSFRVSDDGDTVLFLRSAGPTDPVNSLWRIGRGGDAELLFDAAGSSDGVTDAERARRERAREQASGIVSFAATGDLETILFVLGGELVRVNGRTGAREVLATAGPVFDPRPAPVGDAVAYVSGRSLRITDGDGDRAVSPAEELDTVSWGSAEFVAAEEMGRTRGHWWGPDGLRVLACRVDTAPVREWWIASPEDPEVTPRAVRYPAAGTANADVQLWLLDADGGSRRPVDWQRGEFEYLVDVTWKERLLVTVQTRDQRLVAVLDVDSESGTASELSRTECDPWVEIVPGSPRLVGSRLVTVADLDGARRLVVDGEVVTPNDLQVRSVSGELGAGLLLVASTEPTSAVVMEATLAGELSPLSDPDGWATAAGGGGTVVISQAAADAATSTVVRWHDGTVTALPSLVDEPGFPCTPTFAAVGSHELRTALCLPSGHDGSPLPVLMDPYGGPHAQRVVRARNAFATSQWFAEQGFAVVVVDGRGTPGRGPAFEQAVWGDLATPVLDDQIEALQSLARERPELDLTRVGIRGWSFGGYLAALAVLRHPDVFHAAVAGAPVTDWRLYDTHYTERYLGHPDEYPEHYERTSLLADAARLERPLMLIHGLADDNVVAAHTLTLSRALLEAGRPHQVLPLSGVTHMTPQEQVSENLLHLQRDFLREHLTG